MQDAQVRPAAGPIWALAVSQTIVWAAVYYMFPATLLQVQAETGWSKAAITLAFTLALGISALASPAAGRLIDRGRGVAVLAGGAAAGGALVAALGAALGAGAPYWLFIALWLALGLVMAGALYIPCFSLVTRARGAGARRAITLITLVAGFAGTLSFPAAHLLAEAFGLPGALVALGAAALAVGFPLALWGARRLEGERRARPAPSGAPDARPTQGRWWLGAPAFWLLSGGFACLALTHGVLINHLLPILAERGVPSELAVLAAASVGPMQVAGRVLMLAVERRASSRTITLACFAALIGAPAALLAAGGGPIWLALAVALLGAGAGVVSIMKPTTQRDILGEADFGAVSGAMAVPFLAAFAAAPFVGSLVWEAGGYDLALALLVGVSSLGAAAFWAAGPSRAAGR
ncbi:MAG: MFS transporter [Marivibrio sp.]|uniref:MFS transporter n=1 Tax=Marivibrio sp. TaxID=2039719 RepID=UPI0032EB5E2C